ncbi:glycine cleavage system protein R [Balneatrix alpica]|uniref:Glycine cleavage system transcriptional repressor n=1 Tax=Balneatrix alpica TaxID=75684 RepID=A0ABV5Z900_9GAMM|nr:ACT domain-containing protein [Balneatrix alpica]
MEWILSVMAEDRPGLLERIARCVQNHQGNWEESSLARLAGRFAGIIRITLPESQGDALRHALLDLVEYGLQVQIQPGSSQPLPNRRKVFLDLLGQDQPGIVKEITTILAALEVNIEKLDTQVESGSMSGELMFRALARLSVPDELDLDVLKSNLEAIANDLMVDISLRQD